MRVVNLTWDEYRQWLPLSNENGPLSLRANKEPPKDAVEYLRTRLHDRCIVVAQTQAGNWFIGRVVRMFNPDGTTQPRLYVREILVVTALGDTAVHAIASRSSCFLGSVKAVDDLVMKDLAKIEDDREKKMDDLAVGRMERNMGALDRFIEETRGSRNVPRQDAEAGLRELDAALDAVGGDERKLDPAAAGVRMRKMRGVPAVRERP